MTLDHPSVGLLHPGAMGAAIGGQLVRQGNPVRWLPEGRSRDTAARAHANGLTAATSLAALTADSSVVLSVCPPSAAERVAGTVAGHAQPGMLYVDANAVAPERVVRMAGLFPAGALVDGAVVGSPPTGRARPRLYLSGAADAVDRIARLFEPTALDVRTLGDQLGRASALKLAYTTHQKTSRALAILAHGLAEAHGLTDELLDIAALRPGSHLNEPEYLPKTAARAWRWAPELEEAATLLEQYDLPSDLPRAAARTLRLMQKARVAGVPERALDLLRDTPDGESSAWPD